MVGVGVGDALIRLGGLPPTISSSSAARCWNSPMGNSNMAQGPQHFRDKLLAKVK
jgi:hypothetical protein